MRKLANKVQFSLSNNLQTIAQRTLPQAFEQALLKSTIVIRNNVVKKLAGQGTGRLYRVPATKRTYRASAEGMPPAVRLGHLRNSYRYIVEGQGWDAVGYVGSDIEYSHYLEYGTYKMKPRPHLVPAMQESKPQIFGYFEGIL